MFCFRCDAPRRGLHAFVWLLLTFALSFSARASSYTYTAGSFDQGFGTSDPRRNYNWNNEYNWEPRGIPSGGDSATVTNVAPIFIDQPVTVQNLTLPSSEGNSPNITGGTGGNDLTVTGTLNWSAGRIGANGFGNLIIPAGATMNLLGPDDKVFFGVLNSAATINWSGTGRFAVGGSSVVNNSGLIDITAENAYFGIVENPGPVLNNTGTIRRSAGAGLFSIAGFDAARTDSLRGALNNSGNIEVQSGTFQFHGGRSSGNFSVAPGAVLQCADSHRFDGNTISGAGLFRVSGGSSEVSGTITRNGGPMELLATIRGGFSDVAGSSATYSGDGKFLWKGGSLNGNWTWAAGTATEVSGDGFKQYDGTLTNKGTFDWLGGGPIACGQSTFVNEGAFNCKAAGTFLADTYIYGQTFDNRGTLNTFAGENRADDSGIVNSGTLNIGGASAGTLEVPSFSNSGTLNLGVGDVLKPSGSAFQASSVINVEIAGAAEGQFGAIQSGRSDLGGTLNVNFVNYAPASGNTIRVMTRSGGYDAFANVTTQNLSGKTLETVYDAYFVDLVVRPIALSVNDVSVVEGNSGSTNANIVVTLSQPAPTNVTFNYATLNGTATIPADYVSRSGTLTIPAGQTRALITVPIVGDVRDEANETFFVRLTSASGAVTLDNQATVTILDNDAAPTLSINDVSVGDRSSVASFRVTLSAISNQTVMVRVGTANGTATAGSDYVATSANLSFAPGETSKTFNVQVLGDARDELNETFLALLSSPANATILRGRGVATILDDDVAPSIFIDDLSLRETNGRFTALVRVRLSSPSGQIVRVNFATVNGTALANSDYLAVAPTPVIFSAGSTVAYARVTINGDLFFEANETFFVRLSSALNGVIADGQATVTVLNDDSAPTLSINDVTIVEGNAGSKAMNFTVTLSKPIVQTVGVNYATSNGSALAGSDYLARNGTLAFSPGTALTRIITVPITGDTRLEPNETLFVSLSNAINSSLIKARGVGTISNDDAITPANNLAAPVVRKENASSATLNAANSSLALRFTSTLDAQSATDVDAYQITVNGTPVEIEGASYNRSTNTVTLLLSATAPVESGEVQVRYQLRDATGQTFAGQANLSTP